MTNCSDSQKETPARSARDSVRTSCAAPRKPREAFGRRPGQRSHGPSTGFSILELAVSLLVLSIIVSGVVYAATNFQKSYGRSSLQTDMYENVRGVAELMEQEIGQAGLLSLPSTTLSAAITANATAQAASVSSTTSMFVGENLLVDAGSTSEELVAVTAIGTSTFSGIFTKAHASGAPVTVLGVFPNGVVVPGTTDGSTSVTEPGVSTLNLFGDINADGSLVYVRYTCSTSSTPGTLTRSINVITPGVTTGISNQTLLSTLVPNPGGTACFQYTTATVTVGSTTYTFVTNIGVTLSVRTLREDPLTGQYLTMTKSFLDMSPRNILAGFEQANAGLTNRLQATPSNVLSY